VTYIQLGATKEYCLEKPRGVVLKKRSTVQGLAKYSINATHLATYTDTFY